MRILTFSSVSLASVSASTSAEPCTSALMMIGSSFMPPSAICACSDSSVRRPPLAPSARIFACSSRNVAIWRALAASARPGTSRPAAAGPSRPSTSTGVDGPADFVGRPRSSMSARTRADDRAGDEGVADVQRAVLHEHRRHRAAALVELGFEHGARRVALRVRLQLADVGDEQDHLEQQVEVLLLLRRHFDRDRLAAPFLGHQVELGQLALDALRVGVRLVDLVDRHDDRHVRPPSRGRSPPASAA